QTCALPIWSVDRKSIASKLRGSVASQLKRGEYMATNGRPLITLENVTKIFYTDEVETHALSGIHLEIREGEYVSMAGPSGCGKSTLLLIIGLLDTPTDGTYVLNSKPVQSLDFADRARIRNHEIGFIFQRFHLIADLP